jgi:hypothetical protein
MKGLDPHDPRPMLVIFAGIVLIAAWRALSSITLDGVLALAEPLAPLALGALAIASALAMQRLLHQPHASRPSHCCRGAGR